MTNLLLFASALGLLGGGALPLVKFLHSVLVRQHPTTFFGRMYPSDITLVLCHVAFQWSSSSAFGGLKGTFASLCAFIFPPLRTYCVICFVFYTVFLI